MPAPSMSEPETEADREGQADAPIGDRGIDHRYGRIVKAAQHAAGDGLAAIKDLEQALQRLEMSRRAKSHRHWPGR